jgi:hypothetical protein
MAGRYIGLFDHKLRVAQFSIGTNASFRLRPLLLGYQGRQSWASLCHRWNDCSGLDSVGRRNKLWPASDQPSVPGLAPDSGAARLRNPPPSDCAWRCSSPVPMPGSCGLSSPTSPQTRHPRPLPYPRCLREASNPHRPSLPGGTTRHRINLTHLHHIL